MNITGKIFFVCLAAFCLALFLNSNTFAGKASFEEGGEIDPPYGATGDPGGRKLTGVMYIHYFNYFQDPYDGNYYANFAEFSLRLEREKSGYRYMYYDEYSGLLNFGDPTSILDKFYSLLEQRIEYDFFEGEGMDFKIKSLKNYGNLTHCPNGGYDPGTDNCLTDPTEIIVLVDVELAAKPAEEEPVEP